MPAAPEFGSSEWLLAQLTGGRRADTPSPPRAGAAGRDTGEEAAPGAAVLRGASAQRDIAELRGVAQRRRAATPPLGESTVDAPGAVEEMPGAPVEPTVPVGPTAPVGPDAAEEPIASPALVAPGFEDLLKEPEAEPAEEPAEAGFAWNLRLSEDAAESEEAAGQVSAETQPRAVPEAAPAVSSAAGFEPSDLFVSLTRPRPSAGREPEPAAGSREEPEAPLAEKVDATLGGLLSPATSPFDGFRPTDAAVAVPGDESLSGPPEPDQTERDNADDGLALLFGPPVEEEPGALAAQPWTEADPAIAPRRASTGGSLLFPTLEAAALEGPQLTAPTETVPFEALTTPLEPWDDLAETARLNAACAPEAAASSAAPPIGTPSPVPAAPSEGSDVAPAAPTSPSPPRSPASRQTRSLLRAAGALAVGLLLVGLFALGMAIPSLLGAPSAKQPPTGDVPAVTPAPTVTPKVAAAAGAGVHPWHSLGGGECIEPYTGPWADTFTVVDCAAPHAAQLLYTNLLSTDPAAHYPGADTIAGQINALCTAPGVIDLAAAGSYPDLQVQGAFPAAEAQWASGQRSYYCFASRSSGQPLTSSVAGPGPTG
ncbi:conserved hypothetical protein [Leifsonia xyli subsp. xyli str. CTCB07]|uniref:Septum formation-related domain-containing protein n=1 Tax=Leifsonia xyli subsp. xyli (strain CTCB07) TaxID=281090 RepID=Q6ACA4_LEIXX|nr:conserved hypothetical protein [Leifsonia xyli subsp. xyli str. CTCB07]